jgi:uncharacterized membrane protein YidH (DUF202 family)
VSRQPEADGGPAASAEDAPDPRRRRFALTAQVLFWLFAVCFGLGALQVSVALRSNRVWADYRGHAVSLASMRYELIFLIVAGVLCALAAWHWQRVQHAAAAALQR